MRIQRAKTNSNSPTSSAATALTVVEKQQKHNLENLHRTCAGVTAFRVKDPDPYAVDNGKILGVRIEVSVKGRFAAPYYLLLNRPSMESDNLRIHKHTVPPCVPLPALAARFLPQTPASDDEESAKQGRIQDLHRLVRELRQELVSHHLRLDVITKLRADAGLLEDVEDGSGKRKRKAGKGGIEDVRALDLGAREIEISWTDESTVRILVSRKGVVEKVVAKSVDGNARQRAVERRVMAGDGHIEGVMERLINGQGRV